MVGGGGGDVTSWCGGGGCGVFTPSAVSSPDWVPGAAVLPCWSGGRNCGGGGGKACCRCGGRDVGGGSGGGLVVEGGCR